MTRAAPRKPPGAPKARSEIPMKLLKYGGGPVLAIAILGGLGEIFGKAPDASGATSASGGVPSLNETTFDALLAAYPEGVLVDFYTPNCPFCKKLEPHFQAAALELRKQGGTPLASLDAQAEAAVAARFGVYRYPTVLWFWKGQNVLELPRAAEKDKAGILEWVDWASKPAIEDLATRAELDESLTLLRSSLPDVRPLFFAALGGTAEEREALEAAAQRYRGKTVFLFINEPSESGPALRLYGKEPDGDKDYDGAVTPEAFVKWASDIMEKVQAGEKAAIEKARAEKEAASKEA